MKMKIEIVNAQAEKVSPYAFGTLFTNINEYTIDETAEKTFANIGVYKGKHIQDVTGAEYKIIDVDNNDSLYIVKLKLITN